MIKSIFNALVVVLCIFLFSCEKNETKDLILADFESETYGNWTVEGSAFGTAPAKGRLQGQFSLNGFFGDGLANSFYGGSKAIGKLISPQFIIERDYISLMIGGRSHIEETCVNIIVDEKIVASTTGNSSLGLIYQALDVRNWKGKSAVIEIIDNHKGSEYYSYILVDHIKQTDYPINEKDQSVEFTIDKRYLNIPLLDNTSASHKKVSIKIDNKILGVFDVALASDSIDYYGFIDLSNHQGKKINIEVLKHSGNINKISLNDNIPDDANDLYNEKYRPQLHFTTKRGWINDPNGLIYYKGKYHMYYQYNPFGTKWGNISWGHAVSNDLVHWEEQPAVLYPNPETGMCWSGAAFIDKDNQLGLKTGNEDVIMAFYLRTETGLSYAYSNDGGQKFTDYDGNPVLTHSGARIDTPRPFWFAPTKKWIAPTYDFFTNDKGEKRRCVGFYSSEDLTNWQFESRVEQDGWGDELCGCVDFFQLPVNGNTDDEKWVMIFIDGSYIVGTFDGKTFYTLDGKPASTEDRKESLVIDGNYYATMTWHNMPNNRRVQVTWMKYWDETFEAGAKIYPNMPFNQQFTLPSELTLHKENNEHYLRMNPIEELQKLRTKTHSWKNITLDNTNNLLSDLNKDTYEIELEFTPNENSVTTLDLRGIEVIYDTQKNEISLNKLKTKLKPEKGSVKLQIFIDRTSVEVYANAGKTYMPLIHMMPQDNLNYSILATHGNSNVQSMTVHELSSIW